MAEVNDAARSKKEKNDELLDTLSPQSEQFKVRFTNPFTGEEMEFIQAPLGFFQKLELFSYLGDAIDKATSGDNSISIEGVLGMAPKTANDFNADGFIQGIAKLAKYIPDVMQQCFCIILNVPKADRPEIIEAMSASPENGGLSDDQAISIVETFFEQNAKDLKDFFTTKLSRLTKQWNQTFSQGSKGSSKRSKTTRRTTQKQ